MARILYFCHDNPVPSGGVRVLYRHVEILNRFGFKAFVVHGRPGFRPLWFQSGAPRLYAGQSLGLGPGDWAVIPEDHPAAMEALKDAPCHKAVFCQNHYYVFEVLGPGQTWADYGVSEVLASSQAIEQFVARVFGLRPHLVPVAVDGGLFRPDEAARRVRVAYMPRKGAANIRMARGVFGQAAPHLAHIPWVALEGLNERQTARALAASGVFLATGRREGFGLPPVEAMSAGAIVVGFAGGGGREYADSRNGFWVPDEDPLELAETLIRVLELMSAQPDSGVFTAMREAGHATARRYAPDVMAERLLGFWSARV